MFTKTFWKDTAERAVKTFAQSFGAVLIASGTGLLDVDWMNALSVAGLATVISVATSVGGIKAGEVSTAGYVKLNKED
ncbi:holin [Lactococcus garvieae]|uniref:holin n=1 Tax=Lactococcus garvieae TaxID=1363 RepID=UPI001E3F84BE|nr:holin [Lactococcus garvieae]MDN5628849.1 holin [Lactococcus sp.]UHU65060.1 holin [Lactococcus garvieae]UHU66091.1 holin [Lactococcus garvieae]